VEALDMLVDDGAAPERCGPGGCILAARTQPAVRGRAVAEGRVLVTDAAAQIAPLACGPHPGGIVVDIASGRGTKTAQLQAMAVGGGEAARIFAVDLHRFKADVLTRRMGDLGVPGVTALVGDATDVTSVNGLPAARSADAVLLDAPCTGLGALRRHPEKRWRLTPDDPARLAVLQSAMLEQAASLVRVGGLVVYSTCTVSRVENEDVVSSFLAASDGAFETAGLAEVVPESWAADIDAKGWFGSVPRAGGPDGHFVAALTRSR
jgi:16S rRNA (cytosine967-C5)-methyltransferase